jgi:hypothetical protein
MPIALSGSLALSGSITGSNFRATTDIISPLVTFTNTVGSNGGEIRIAQTQYKNGNNIVFQYSQTTDSNGTKDLGFRRNNTGSLEIYDGVTADGAVANRRDLILRNITGSNASFSGSVIVSGSLTTTGTITAQTLVVQTITSSVEYSSGSNVFGSNTGNTHQFTGSVLVSGSQTVNGNVTAAALSLSNTDGYLGTINSTAANGAYFAWQTSGTTIADIGTAQQIFGSGGSTTFGLNARGARDLVFGSNNTERMRISGSGNVGIGTTNPIYTLDVSGTGRFTTNITIDGAGSSIKSGNELRFYRTDNGIYTKLYDAGSLAANGFVLDNTNGEGFHFKNNGTTIMRMPSNGNVGIGITAPSRRLHIYATDDTRGLLVHNTSSTSYAEVHFSASREYRVGTGGSASDAAAANSWYIYDNTASAHRFTINSSGSVGIGITNPAAKLVVSNAGLTGIELDPSGSSIGGASISSYNRGASSRSDLEFAGKEMQFYTGNPSLVIGLKITSGSNVGIGTTSPSKTLDVFGSNGNATSQIKVKSTGNTSAGYFGTFSNSLYISAGGTYDSGWTLDGTNGIANIVMETSNGGSAIAFGTAASNTTATERMRITNSGSVGINITAPTQRLSIRGNQVFTNPDVDGVANALIAEISSQARGYSNQGSNMASIQFRTNPTTWYKGDIAFLTNDSDGTNVAVAATERMRISSAGVVTRPYQPFFYGGLASDQSISATTFTTLNFVSTQGFYGVNTGGHWNNSTYGFTAPVTGMYLITLSIYTNTVGQVALHVNGVRKHSIPASNYSSGTVTYGGSAMIPLTVGEVLTLQGYGSSSGVLYTNLYHTWASIYLL